MKKLLALALCIAMALTCLTGCGGSDNTTTAENGNAGNDSAVTTAGKKDDGKENVFVFSRSATISGLDPILQATGMATILKALFYENLVTSDYGNGYQPELATSWERSDDGLTWTFHLREGVKFTDGNTFDSADVCGVFNRIWTNDKAATQKASWSAIVESWEAPDDMTVVLHMKKAFAENYILNKLTTLSIFSNKRFEQYGEDMFLFDDTMKPVGTGAFIPDKWTVGGDVEFVRNKEWWGIGVLGEESNVDRLIYRPLTEEATRIAGIQTGELDWIDNVSVEYKDRLSSEKNVTVEQLDSSLFVYLLFACDRGIFQDINARKAAYWAIDREMLANAIAGGGEGAALPIPSTVLGYDPSEPIDPQDMAKAKEYLAKTNYNGEELVLLASNGLFARSKEIYEAVASMLTEAGFNISLQVLDNATVGTKRNNKEFDLHITNVICGDYPSDMFDRWTRDVHKGGYQNQEMWDLIEGAYCAKDRSEEEALISKAAHMAKDETAPVTGLYRGDVLIAFQNNISNFHYHDTKNYFNFSHVQKQ